MKVYWVILANQTRWTVKARDDADLVRLMGYAKPCAMDAWPPGIKPTGPTEWKIDARAIVAWREDS